MGRGGLCPASRLNGRIWLPVRRRHFPPLSRNLRQHDGARDILNALAGRHRPTSNGLTVSALNRAALFRDAAHGNLAIKISKTNADDTRPEIGSARNRRKWAHNGLAMVSPSWADDSQRAPRVRINCSAEIDRSICELHLNMMVSWECRALPCRQSKGKTGRVAFQKHRCRRFGCSLVALRCR